MNLSQAAQQAPQPSMREPSMQTSSQAEHEPAVTPRQPERLQLQRLTVKPPTFGQRLADKLATKVGSWAFLIGQSTVLAGWVGCNLMPGVPHWDESPFILLNLVFSFASAYTAPVVLMSQNRQSEEDREHAAHNYRITLQAAHNIELLHDKMDALYTQKLGELSDLIKQQQTAPNFKLVVLRESSLHSGAVDSKVAILHTQPDERFFVNVAESQSFKSLLDLNGKKIVTSDSEINQFCNF